MTTPAGRDPDPLAVPRSVGAGSTLQFGVMLLADRPAAELVELAQLAERGGFDYFWLNDCDLLFRNPWPLLTTIAEQTERIRIGPLVTNPVTRHWAVTANLLATLQEISGGRMVCGVGRGDAAVRVIGHSASSVTDLEAFIRTLRRLVSGQDSSYQGSRMKIHWGTGWPLEVWGAGYGPQVLGVVGRECDGVVVQGADPTLIGWSLRLTREAASESERGSSVRAMAAAPAYVAERDLDHAYEQVNWFAGLVTRHIRQVAARQVAAREGDLPMEVRPATGALEPDIDSAALRHAAHESISSSSIERFCLVGDIATHLRRLRELQRMGIDCYTLYLNHDAARETVGAYASEMLPEFRR